MTDSEPGGCCRCCCSFIFTLGLTSLFMWLSLRVDNPKCSVQYFYLPALNKTLGLNTSTNSTLDFQLSLDNGNKDKGIYYDAVNVTFHDNPNRSLSHLMGDYTILGFYQGHQKKAKKGGSVELNRTLLSRAVFPNGSAVFRVDMATRVRFKILFWKTKKYSLVREASVEVNDQGIKVNKKGIKLNSSAPQPGYYRALVGVFLSSLVLISLNFGIF